MIIKTLYNKKAVTNLVTKSEIVTNRFLRSRIVTKVCYTVKRFAHRLFERFTPSCNKCNRIFAQVTGFFLDKKRI